MESEKRSREEAEPEKCKYDVDRHTRGQKHRVKWMCDLQRWREEAGFPALFDYKAPSGRDLGSQRHGKEVPRGVEAEEGSRGPRSLSDALPTLAVLPGSEPLPPFWAPQSLGTLRSAPPNPPSREWIRPQQRGDRMLLGTVPGAAGFGELTALT